MLLGQGKVGDEMWFVEHELEFAPLGEADSLQEKVTTAYVHLQTLDGVIDPGMTGSMANHVVRWSMLVDVAGRVEALQVASAALRTALHHAFIGTPGWEEAVDRLVEDCRQSSEKVLAEPEAASERVMQPA